MQDRSLQTDTIPQSIESVLQSKGPLQYILAKADQIRLANQLLKKVTASIAPALSSNCFAGVFLQQKLTLSIYASNASWATLLRNYQEHIIEYFQQNNTFSKLEKIKIRLSLSVSALSPMAKTETPSIFISETTSQLLKETASHISFLPLKESLLALSTNSKRKLI